MGRRFNEQQLELLRKEITDLEEFQLLLEADDPVLWGETYLCDPDTGESRFECKEQFVDLLRCPKLNRAARVGRQQGKTVHLCVDILHSSGTAQRQVSLVFVPSKKQMNRMLEIISNLLRGSELKASYRMGKKMRVKDSLEPEYDYEIKCSTGSVIRFFFMDQKPDKARGQAADRIYIDEAEYLPEKAWPVINGIIKGNPSIPIWASSTPSGLEDTWFKNFCDRCSDPKNNNGAEYHLPSNKEKNWPEIELRLRDLIFDEVTWKLEVLAEWAEARGAVYKKEVIDRAIESANIGGIYPKMEELRDTLEYNQAIKFLGVDWNNPQNGVRIIELSLMYNKLWLTRHEKISYEQYTQLVSVDTIMSLELRNKYRIISLDCGYGETQIELLTKGLSANGLDPSRILNIVDSGKKEKVEIMYNSPGGGRRKETIVVRTKTKIVGLVGKYLETTLVIPKEEDEYREGLVKEMRNFKRKESLREGGFEYSDKTHSLSALQICIHGYDRVAKSLEQNTDSIARSIATSDLNQLMRSVKIERTASYAIAAGSLISSTARSGNRTQGLSYGRQRRTIL